MKITFPSFRRWCAIVLDGEPIGYMADYGAGTTMHLKHDAPKWLRDVRDGGPYADTATCKAAIQKAAPGDATAFLLGDNVVAFPAKATQ